MTEIEAGIEHLHVVQRGDGDARVAHLAVNVGAGIGVVAIKRHRIEGGREPLGRLVVRQQLETTVGAEGIALAGEHARRVLALTLEGEDAGGEGEVPGQVLIQQEAQDLALVGELGQRHLGDLAAADGGAVEARANLAPPHPGDQLVAAIGLAQLRPGGQQRQGLGTDPGLALLGQGADTLEFGLAGPALEHAPAGQQLLAFARRNGLLPRFGAVIANRLRHLAQVARALAGRDRAAARRNPIATRQRRGPVGQAARPELVENGLIKHRHAFVVELGGDGAEDRHLLGCRGKTFVVALNLLAHVPESIVSALAVELVDRHQVGEIQHVDLLELAGGAVFRRHGVNRQIDVGHDTGIALAYPRSLDQHQTITRGLATHDGGGQAARQFVA